MPLTIYQVDAFADQPFAGNPAAVCLLPEQRDDRWMQAVAQEMNLSETAFLVRRDDGFDLRWFTPAVEVDLCGHATLASAHILWETGELHPEEVARFYTRSGLLTAVRDGASIVLDFPAENPEPTETPKGLVESLGLVPADVRRNRMDYLVALESAEEVWSAYPDFGRLAKLPVRGVIVTSRSDDARYDFISRFFAPAAGVNEDPATGSAHCCLGPYWQEKLGKSDFLAYQASKRGAVISVSVRGNRVKLGGPAVIVLRGELRA
jgi:PhzF family phenazine biosynthesis protein